MTNAMFDSLMKGMGYSRVAPWEDTIEGAYVTLRVSLSDDPEDGEMYSGLGLHRGPDDDLGLYISLHREDWLRLATICEHMVRRIDRLEAEHAQ